MKVYTSKSNAPNPRALKIILTLKGLEPETIKIDLLGGENRGAEFKKINPAAQLPCLVTDSGAVIAEVAAIAEYLDEIQPDPTLSGHTAEERAETRMKVRQMDYWIIGPMMASFRHSIGKDFFAERINIHEDLAVPSAAMAQDGLGWLNKQMAGKKYLCGDRLTYGDAIFFASMEFAEQVGQKMNPDHKNLISYMGTLGAHEVFAAN